MSSAVLITDLLHVELEDREWKTAMPVSTERKYFDERKQFCSNSLASIFVAYLSLIFFFSCSFWIVKSSCSDMRNFTSGIFIVE